MSKKIYFLVFFTCFLLHTASAQNLSKSDMEQAVRYTMVAKIKSVIYAKLYGEGGRRPKNEQDLLDSCRYLPMSDLEESLQSKRKIISSSTNQKDILEDLDIDSAAEFQSSMKRTENDITESLGAFVWGYCDKEAGKCNDMDTSCKNAVSWYESAFKKLLADKSALDNGIKGLCHKMMKAVAQANKDAVPEIEMCRLEQDNVAEKAQATEEKIVHDQNIELKMTTPEKPVKKYEENTSGAGTFKRSSGASAQ